MESILFQAIPDMKMHIDSILAIEPSAGIRQGLEVILRQGGYRVVMESSNVDLSSVYVEMGLGISFATVVPGLPVLKRRNLAFIPLPNYFDTSALVVLMRKGSHMSTYKSGFLDSLVGSVPVSDREDGTTVGTIGDSSKEKP